MLVESPVVKILTLINCFSRGQPTLQRMKTFSAYYKSFQAYAFMAKANMYSGAVLGCGPTVALATSGPRIPNVRATVLSIAMGVLKPRRLLVVVPAGERIACIMALGDLFDRGVEVVGSNQDYGPHNKWWLPSHTNSTFVTADDATLYPSWWLACLAGSHAGDPMSVTCMRAKTMWVGRPYRDWLPVDHSLPSPVSLAIGCSGVLYPASVVQKMQYSSYDFLTSCPKHADLWLKKLSLDVAPTRQVFAAPQLFLEVPGTLQSSITPLHQIENDDAVARVFSGVHPCA